MKVKFFLVGLLICSLTTLKAETNEAINKGVKLIEEAQYNTALAYFNKQSKSVDSEYQLGKIYLILGQNDKAVAHFSEAAKLNPASPLALVAQLAIEVQNGNNVAVKAAMKKLRKFAKKDAQVIAEATDVCFLGTKKEYADASELIDFGRENLKQNSVVVTALGDLEFSRAEYGKALSAYEWAIGYNASNAQAYRKMGLIQTYARDYRNSVASFKKSIDADPSQILVYKNFSDLQFLYGKFEESLTLYNTYLSRTEQNIEDKERYALILFFNKKYNESNKELDIVLKENPNSAVLYRIRGYSAYETGDYKSGVALMKTFFEKQPENKIILSDYTYYGKLNAKTNNDSLALVYLNKAIAIDSSNTALFEDLVSIYTKQNKYDQAVKSYGRMINNGYPKVTGQFYIARKYYDKGVYLKTVADSLTKAKVANTKLAESALAFRAADSVFTEVTVLSPEYLGGYTWKARSLANLDPESTQGLAKPAYEKVIEICEKGDVSKTKATLIEAYGYLAYYNYTVFDSEYKTNPANSKAGRALSEQFCAKAQALDPNDSRTKAIAKIFVDYDKNVKAAAAAAAKKKNN